MRWMVLAALLTGCGDSDGDDKGGDDSDTTDDTEDTTSSDNPNASNQGLSLTEAPTGDFTCFTPATTLDASVWIEQMVDAAKTTDLAIAGEVQDFEEETPVDNTEVRVWYNDDPSSTASDFKTNDGAGKVSFTAPACTPISYKTNPVPGLEDQAKQTYKAHQVYPWNDGGTATAEYISVSDGSYNVIPAIYGITPDTTKSIIAGTAFDCTRSPDTESEIDDGKVEGAQILLRAPDGSIPPGVQIRYFTERFPDRDRTTTSEDGLWIAINVPIGEFRAEMWGKVDGEDKLLGVSQLRSYADSINIANIFAGYDSVKYPAACVMP